MTNDLPGDDFQWPYSKAATTATGPLNADSPVLFELVGSVATMGGLIEHTMRNLVCWLAAPEEPPEGPWELVTNGQSIGWLSDYAVSIGNLRYGDADWWPVLRTTVQNARTAMDKQRNAVVHAVYLHEGAADVLGRRSRLKQMTPETFPVTAEELRGRYRALHYAFVKLVGEWLQAIGAYQRARGDERPSR